MKARLLWPGVLVGSFVGAVAVAVWASDRGGGRDRIGSDAVPRASTTAKVGKQDEDAGMGEEDTSTDRIPAEVRESLIRHAKGARIAKYWYEKQGGSETYGAEWVVDRRQCSAAVTPSGELVQCDEEMAANDVPPAVRNAASKALPGAKGVVFVKWVTVEYDVRAIVNGEEREVVLSPTGRVVETDEDEGEHAGEKDKPEE